MNGRERLCGEGTAPVKSSSAGAKGGKGAKKAGAAAAAAVKVGEKTVSILDGQHRVGALEILLKKEARVEPSPSPSPRRSRTHSFACIARVFSRPFSFSA